MKVLQLKGNAGAAVSAAVAVAVGLAVACRTVATRPASAERKLAIEAYVEEPSIRVAVVTAADRVVLTADAGGVVVWPQRSRGRHPVPLAAGSFRPGARGHDKVRLVESGEETTSAVVVPAARGDTLRVDGEPYRGVLEVRPDDSGLTVVNIVNLEDYLRGVVPNELSPLAFPQPEALKAQAVAARTYALKNRGKFQDKGYDLCATAACQVYRGKGSEQPASDESVEETRGIVATYDGAPIEAYYTSTCGGHTEDVANVFEGESEPYLRGVVCVPEQSAWSLVRSTAPTRTLGDEEDLSRNAALLISMGVLDRRPDMAAYLEAQATDADLKAWTRRLLRVTKRKGCPTPAETPLARRGAFFRYLVGSVCWDERARLLSPGDSDYLLHVEDRSELLGAEETVAAALLVQEGVLTPFPDNTLRAGRAISRGRAATLIARTLEKLGAPNLLSGDFQGAESGEMTVSLAGRKRQFDLDPEALLFRNLDGARSAASELSLAVGDHVSFVASEGRVVFLEADQSRKGDAADRTSRYFRWEVRLTPAEVARAVARYGSVGTVKDVLPRRIGTSGRVVDLAVVGSDGELDLKGMRIRFALGLRENLFVIDREMSDVGDLVDQFVFTGKGWGHGVGLCQVGAYGMARAGSRYDQILSHYYPGTSLTKMY